MSLTDTVDIAELQKKIAELINENKSLKKQKKFGLVWEDKPDAQVLRVRNEAPMLCEDPSKAVVGDANAANHVLINGDNFHALTALRATHMGKVDVIYIDPPYNTGNKDFIYNDNFLDKEDGYRHSKWLSFMEKRLALAKELLSDTGVIFVSIDDNEHTRLKLLMDEVFGPDNYINNIIVKTKTSSGASGGGEDKRLKKNVEYLLFYAKEKERFTFSAVYSSKKLEEVIQEKEAEGKSYEYRSILISEGTKELFQTIKDGSGSDIKIYAHLGHKISSVKTLMNEENLSREEVYHKYHEKIFRTTNAQTSIRTRVKEATEGSDGLFSIEYIPRSGKSKGQIARNHYIGNQTDMFAWLRDTSSKTKNSVIKSEKIGTLWDDLSWTGLANEGGVKFENGKKPVAFLKRIISLSSAVNPLVLDFFAGSGSTAHAVAELNKEDGGSRQCILVTDGGKTEVVGESAKNAKGDTTNIAEEITYERVRRVLTGKDWADGKEHEPLGGNLRYFKVVMEQTPHGATERDQRLTLEKYTIEHAKIAENVFDVVASKDEFDDETLTAVDYKIFAAGTETRYLVGVNSHDYVLSELEEWFAGLPLEAKVIMVGNGLEEIGWVKNNSTRIQVDDVLGRTIRSRQYVASKLPLG